MAVPFYGHIKSSAYRIDKLIQRKYFMYIYVGISQINVGINRENCLFMTLVVQYDVVSV